MSFLLKIVQGPNAGAEIALAEGVALSVGSADTCDIVFSDAAVEPLAFELEVTEERVMAILPGGKSIRLDPYHVTLVGTTALVIGPLEGAWQELIWPKRDVVPEDEAAQPEDEEEAPVAETEAKTRRSLGWLWVILVILLILLIGALLFWKFPEQSKTYAQRGWSWTQETTASLKKMPPPPAPVETLADIARACGFAISEKGGEKVAFGNFVTRADRLRATARAYAAQPGISVDFADEESLKAAVDELLTLVSEDRVQALKVEGRKLFLSGTVSSQMALRKILESVSADVPKITETDCSEVTITGMTLASAEIADDDGPRYHVPRLPAQRSTQHTAAAPGVMPIIGILTVPYPCLVLENGTRVMEGARFGDYTVEKIEADAVTVSGSEGPFVWRP